MVSNFFHRRLSVSVNCLSIWIGQIVAKFQFELQWSVGMNDPGMTKMAAMAIRSRNLTILLTHMSDELDHFA